MDKNNQTSKDDPIELLRLIASKADHEVANHSFRRFHAMYLKKIRFMSFHFFREYGIKEPGLVDEIASNVLYKVWENAGKFKADPSLAKAEREKKLQAWLRTIVRNEYLLYLRAQVKRSVIPREELRTISVLDERASKKETYHYKMDALPETEDEPYDIHTEEAYEKKFRTELRAIRNHLKTLPKEHKQVFDTYLYHADQNGKLPPGMFQDLCKKTGLHKEYPKKIKMRVMDDLKNLFKGDTAI